MLRGRWLGMVGLGALAAAVGCIAPTENIGQSGEPLRPDGPPGKPTEIQLLAVSDWHGQLDPTGGAGGAAYLSTYFKQERAKNPNTLTLTAGDAVGASPPLSGLFEDKPAIEAMNLMGFDADTFGNHNFDKGIGLLQKQIGWANFQYVSSNLGNLGENLTGVAHPYHLVTVGNVKVGIVGITNDDAPSLLFPGSMGTLTVQSSAEAANSAIHEAKKAGAEAVVVLVHMGATGKDAAGNPTGPLMDFARAVKHADVVIGDHTNMQVNTYVAHDADDDKPTLVVENLSKGVTYARITLKVAGSAVLESKADIVRATIAGVTPDPAINSMLAPYRAALSAKMDVRIGEVTATFVRSGNNERLREIALGNLIADSMRVRYGTQIALTNGGGIRASLPSTYAPADKSLRRPASGYAAGPPYDTVLGDAYTILPFGNAVVTRTISGAQLWKALELSVSALPAANGRFLQISGFRYTYTLSVAAGAGRVQSVALDDGTPIPNDATFTLTAALPDFVNAGGDGYSVFADGQGVVRETMADVFADHMKGKTLTPSTDGRITQVP